jgi:hypothetical protein
LRWKSSWDDFKPNGVLNVVRYDDSGASLQQQGSRHFSDNSDCSIRSNPELRFSRRAKETRRGRMNHWHDIRVDVKFTFTWKQTYTLKYIWVLSGYSFKTEDLSNGCEPALWQWSSEASCLVTGSLVSLMPRAMVSTEYTNLINSRLREDCNPKIGGPLVSTT